MGKKTRAPMVFTVQVRPPQKKLEVNITAIFSDQELKALSTKFSYAGIEAGIKNALKGFFDDLTGYSTQLVDR